MNWERVKLEEVATTSSGGTPSRAKKEYWNGNIPWIKSGQLRDSIICDCDEFISEKGLNNSSANIVKNGTLLIALYGATAGKLGITNIDAATNQAVCAITPDESKLNKRYLFYYLLFLRPKILNDASGGAQPNISQAYVRNIKILLPPITIQEQIADKLDKADELFRKDHELMTMHDQLTQSIFYDMFGDPLRNEKEWAKIKLKELCEIKRGASPRPIDKFIGDEVHWIKIGDATNGDDMFITKTKVKITKEGAKKSVSVKPGELIFANCGVSLGFARISKIYGCIHDGWLSLEIKEVSIVNQVFLLKLINTMTNYLRDIAPDGTQPNLNIGIMKELEIIVPPLELQETFSSRVFLLNNYKKVLAKTIINGKSLNEKLLQFHFS